MTTYIRIDPKKDCLLAVDVSETFMPGTHTGLPVDGGDEIVIPLKRTILSFPAKNRFASDDQHAYGSVSLCSSYRNIAPKTALTIDKIRDWTEESLAPHALFTIEELHDYLSRCRGNVQIAWDPHGEFGSPEAAVHPLLRHVQFAQVIHKGTDRICDSYSAFFDNLGRSTGLAAVLKRQGFGRIIVCGLAYDFCVGWTAEDAAKLGFEVVVLKDLTRSVNLPGSVEATDRALAAAGVTIANSSDLEFAA